MSYRPVDEAFWTDPKVRGLSVQNKLLFLYFITNPHANFSGVYYLPFPTLIFETGFSEKDARMGINTLSDGYMVRHDEANSLFWVVKMAKFQVVSEKQRDGVSRHFKSLQKSFILSSFAEKYPSIISPEEYPTDTLSNGYAYPTDTTETDSKQKQKENKAQKTAPIIFPLPLNTPDFLKTWDEWKAYRKEKKKTLTGMGEQKSLDQLAKFGSAWAIERINKAIASGWIGLIFDADKPECVRPVEIIPDHLKGLAL